MIYNSVTVIYYCSDFLAVCTTVPHSSEFGSGAWPGLKHWRKLCCSLRVHTRMVSLQCANGGGSSNFPGENKPYYSLQTEKGNIEQFLTTAKLRENNCHLS